MNTKVLKKGKSNKLYRYYNLVAGKHGEVFALCKKHEPTLVKITPSGNAIAENIGRGQLYCNQC